MIKTNYGLQIFDAENNYLAITLSDILNEIDGGDEFYWLITFLDGMPNKEKAELVMQYQTEINESDNGHYLDWNELKKLSEKYFQRYEIEVLGCSDKDLLRKYKNDEEMIKNCNIVIIEIDCTCWEVYAKDQNLIEKLKFKFKKTEIID